MTLDTNELRRLAQAALAAPDGLSAEWMDRLGQFQEAADASVVSELLGRLGAAESDCLEQARLNGMGASREATLMAKLEAAEKSDAESIAMYRKARDERDALRAKVSDLMINVAFLDNLKKSYEELIEELQEERDELRAKIEAMERQAPAMWANSSNIISARISTERGSAGDQHTCSETKTAYHDTPLYVLNCAKGE